MPSKTQRSTHMPNRLTNLQVEFISLVEAPANGKSLILKNGELEARVFQLLKTDDELQVAYGLVYAPEEVDAQDDIADSATIRRAAYEFMRKRRTDAVDVEHGFSAINAFVAESWIVQKGDPMFSELGAWAVGVRVDDIDIWRRLKKGELTGLSLAGIAQRTSAEPQPSYTEKDAGDKAPNWFTNFIKSITNKGKDMDEAQVRDIVKAMLNEQAQGDSGAEDSAPPSTDEAPTGTTAAETAPSGVSAADLEEALTKQRQELEQGFDEKLAKALAKGSGEAGNGSNDEESYV